MSEKPLSELLDEILALDELILPLPLDVARTGLELVDNGPCAEQLRELVSCDPVLSATLFRLANSAFYRGLSPVAGIEEALTRIGLEQACHALRQLCIAVLAAPPGQLLPAYLPGLARHSRGCALGSRWLAERCGYRLLAEPAHLAGLLHHIGKYLLLAGLERLAARDEIARLLAPQLVAGILADRHVAAGLHLQAAWGLPAMLAAVIGRPHGGSGEAQELLVLLVRLASLACRKLGLGSPAEVDLVLPTTAEAQALGLDEIALAELEIMLEDRLLLALDNPACAGYDLNVVQSQHLGGAL